LARLASLYRKTADILNKKKYRRTPIASNTLPDIHVDSRHRPLVLTACMLSMFMAAVEVTIVATAMPSIIADLGGFSLLGWVFAIYLLTQAITVPIYGRLADLYGCRKMFFIGTALFLGGSVLCGFAPSLVWMIAFRALQGLGAGAITPVATTLIANIYGPHERAKAQGYLASVWGVSAIVGPLLGAFIVQHFHWSVVFWINLPIGIVAMLILAKYLPAEESRKTHALDLAGTGLLSLAVAAMLLALLQAESLGYYSLLLVGLAVMASALLVRQEKRAPEPLFPLSLWQNKVVVAGNIGGIVIGASMMGISAFLPTYVQGGSRRHAATGRDHAGADVARLAAGKHAERKADAGDLISLHGAAWRIAVGVWQSGTPAAHSGLRSVVGESFCLYDWRGHGVVQHHVYCLGTKLGRCLGAGYRHGLDAVHPYARVGARDGHSRRNVKC